MFAVFQMALVAYGSSDDSESEHEGDDTPTSSIPILSAPKKARETVKITIPSLQEVCINILFLIMCLM